MRKTSSSVSKRSNLGKRNKIEVVMKEFKRGTLHSGSGSEVRNRKQAVAIALSEAKKSKRK
jgi:ribosomal protein S21